MKISYSVWKDSKRLKKMSVDLADINIVKSVLARHGFAFSKSLGQNFLIDSSVCPRMADAAATDKSCGVLEVDRKSVV